MSERELYNKITRGAFLFPEHISKDAKDLLKKILIVNPKNRIEAHMVIRIKMIF
jgi:5'-AMP-activated protein kinase catalytic alpha subunit